MLVVISDLHLQEDQNSALAASDTNRSEKNVSADGLNLLFEEIRTKVQEQGGQEIILCLAGDIFEINRNDTWFEGTLRPYHEGMPPAELEAVVTRILDAIVRDNSEFFLALENFVRHQSFLYQGKPRQLDKDIPVKTRYLPGNHDRLLNAWPKLRAKVRQLLCLEGDEKPFDHQMFFPKTTQGHGYGVLIRHGHEYDDTNFSQSFKPIVKGGDRYLYSCLGDIITLEFVAYFPYRFRQLYAIELCDALPRGDFYRHLYSALLDFDDVRPAASLFSYLIACVQSAKQKARELQTEERSVELLRPILLEAFRTVSKAPLIRREVRNVLLKLLFMPPGSWLMKGALRYFPASLLGMGLHMVGALRSRVEAESPAVSAGKEKELIKGTVDTVIAGHTHHPDQVPLEGDDRFFIDSGTWRTLIYQGDKHEVFGHLRAMTFVFCFRSDEGQGNRRFETWTGHLAKPLPEGEKKPRNLGLVQVS